MEHGERIKIVRGIHIRIQKTFADSVLFGGIYGSTATGRDTKHSDIEMMYVMKERFSSATKAFLYRGLPIEVNLISVDMIRRWIAQPSLHTPVYMGNLQNLQLLIGDNRQRQEWLDDYADMSHATIKQFFLEQGSLIGYESLNKIRSLTNRANRYERGLYVFEVVQEISLALALLNRRPVTKGYVLGVKESFDYPLLPADYQDHTEQFMRAEDLQETIHWGIQLLARYEEFLQEQGIEIRNVETLDEIDWQLG
jgi:hypothetical protein